jgi:hypothetical protein
MNKLWKINKVVPHLDKRGRYVKRNGSVSVPPPFFWLEDLVFTLGSSVSSPVVVGMGRSLPIRPVPSPADATHPSVSLSSVLQWVSHRDPVDREHDCRVACVIEHRAMSAHHPIRDFLAVNEEGRSRFAVEKRRHHGRWAQEYIPFIEELLPGEHGLVAPVQGLQVVCQRRWSRLILWLEGSNHHAN